MFNFFGIRFYIFSNKEFNKDDENNQQKYLICLMFFTNLSHWVGFPPPSIKKKKLLK